MGKTAIVFAGQGAQFVGMGKDLVEAYPECKALYKTADDILGYSLSRICFEGPVEELTKSNNCQPAIFVTSMACRAALMKEAPCIVFDAAAGLSLGEWTALHMAGALTFEATLRILEARGRFMQEACEEKDGTMVSVMGLSPNQLQEICAVAGVEVSNLNSPEQTVLSGERAAIHKAEEMAKAAGASRTVVLNVAGAYHSALMAPAARLLEGFLKDIPFQPVSIPVVSNVTGAFHSASENVRQTMVKQVTSTVKWVSCIQHLRDAGVDRYVEVGPGRILSGLIKRIDSKAFLHSIQDLATLKKAVTELTGTTAG
ncbi:MAG: ACP S-malonyltransferase [bacterium]